jgi:hypothetical protein
MVGTAIGRAKGWKKIQKIWELAVLILAHLFHIQKFATVEVVLVAQSLLQKLVKID